MTRVLIIDDETTVLLTVGEMLKLEDYEVEIALDGDDGIQLATSAPPDLIICDLMMPRLSGFDVLKELRSHQATQAVAIIMISGIRDEYVKEKIINGGANAYLVKPFTRDELFKVIAAVL